MIRIFCDGSSKGNGDHAGIGIVIFLNGRVIKVKEYIGMATNNVAEYTALKRALEIVTELGIEDRTIKVFMDSELVVRQMRNEYAVRDPDLARIKHEIDSLIASNNLDVKFQHIGREYNTLADKLANEAIERALSTGEPLEHEKR